MTWLHRSVTVRRSRLPGAVLLGLSSSLYVFFGGIFTVGAIAFPQELAMLCGLPGVANDVTQIIHLSTGLGALVVGRIGFAGLRAWVAEHSQRFGFVAAVALTTFSCMFGLMPATRSLPLLLSGLALIPLSGAALLVVLEDAE